MITFPASLVRGRFSDVVTKCETWVNHAQVVGYQLPGYRGIRHRGRESYPGGKGLGNGGVCFKLLVYESPISDNGPQGFDGSGHRTVGPGRELLSHSRGEQGELAHSFTGRCVPDKRALAEKRTGVRWVGSFPPLAVFNQAQTNTQSALLLLGDAGFEYPEPGGCTTANCLLPTSRDARSLYLRPERLTRLS